MKNITRLLDKKRIYFDGATGTILSTRGLKPGQSPESWNIESPYVIEELHKEYITAGADIIKSNTFGANPFKFTNYDEIIKVGLEIANNATIEFKKDIYVALDIGPLGKLIKPLGDLDFEDAVSAFSDMIKAANNNYDLILIETFTDIRETKAAVIAAKENSKAPIFVTNAYTENGKLLCGATPEAVVAMLEGLGVSALGINCSLGPREMRETVKRICEASSTPVICNPNAGMPEIINGEAKYTINKDVFATLMAEISSYGVNILGGCCGTTPEYIESLVLKTEKLKLKKISEKETTIVSSYTHTVEIGNKPVIIGERINPTGKQKLKDALKNEDLGYIESLAIEQEENGADILDINCGVPGINEKEILTKVVYDIQSICDLPLQIDSSNAEAMESALRIYAGKPLINSVNGKKESLNQVLPLARKYGGTLIALTLDEKGIPNSAEERFQIAKKIVKAAEKYDIDKKNIVFDPLVMTIATNTENANITLETVKLIKSKLGCKCSLGISNVSFGLPNREFINANFLTMALCSKVDAVIINPCQKEMKKAYYSYLSLSGKDINFDKYISFTKTLTNEVETETKEAPSLTLEYIILKGLKEEAKNITLKKLEDGIEPLSIIDEVICALNIVGAKFEDGSMFLPQLLNSAETASVACDIVKSKFAKTMSTETKKIILATVKGDIHDIGKNIVKVLLENYGYTVIDLGKDVPPEVIVKEAKKQNVKLIGLSALMTTTVPAMEETIKQIKEANLDTKIIVGGAVLSEEYALSIGADAYAKDAMQTVKYANSIL